MQTRFVCQFNIEGRVTSVNAQLLGDTIYCDAMEFGYTSKASNLTAAFAVIWGGSKPLDNPHEIHGKFVEIEKKRQTKRSLSLINTLKNAVTSQDSSKNSLFYG